MVANGIIRVLLADDSSLVREMLREILQQEAGIEVVGTASNGREAVDMARDLKPDLITMDLEMPVMSGMDSIAAIMGSKAVPILVVSGVADARTAYEAVRRGALEVVGKPDYSGASAAEFVSKVRMLAGVPVITHIRPILDSPPVSMPVSSAPSAQPAWPHTFAKPQQNASQRIFAIATSTGGPQVLSHMLPLLPPDFPCPVLIAQHISEGFAAGMADWLGALCKLPVKLATQGEDIVPGTVYIAPAEYHCTVNSHRKIALLERGSGDIYRPSCDHLLSSVAEVYRSEAVGIILTGMGKDGAQGIARIRENGGTTIGQDSATSLIYGMNRCAIEAGSVQKVLPESDIAVEMLRLAGL